jgi:hypothetical protein
MGSITAPFAASAPREPTQRPRPIPPAVRGAALKMIYEGCDLVAAAQASNIRPDTLRRWLHRSELVSLIRRERMVFRQSICSSNEYILQELRNSSENFMVRLGAVRELERLADDASMRRAGDVVSPGITIRVLNFVQDAKAGQAIDVTPAKAPFIDVEGSQ